MEHICFIKILKETSFIYEGCFAEKSYQAYSINELNNEEEAVKQWIEDWKVIFYYFFGVGNLDIVKIIYDWNAYHSFGASAFCDSDGEKYAKLSRDLVGYEDIKSEGIGFWCAHEIAHHLGGCDKNYCFKGGGCKKGLLCEAQADYLGVIIMYDALYTTHKDKEKVLCIINEGIMQSVKWLIWFENYGTKANRILALLYNTCNRLSVDKRLELYLSALNTVKQPEYMPAYKY